MHVCLGHSLSLSHTHTHGGMWLEMNDVFNGIRPPCVHVFLLRGSFEVISKVCQQAWGWEEREREGERVDGERWRESRQKKGSEVMERE